MIYNGYFRNTNTDVDPEGQLYYVRIVSGEESGEEKELLFADNAFVVEYEESSSIFKPYKCSTATINLLNTEFDPNLNAVSALDVSVRLYKVLNNNELVLEWAGYTIPNAYSQGYNSSYDSFELECQDCLSTLKYQDCILSREDGLFTVGDYLSKMMSQLQFIDHLYVSDNIRVPLICTDPRDSRENINRNSVVSNILLNNIFLNDPSDDEKYRKSLDVLGEICTILGLTAIQKGDSVYLVSYDAIAYEYPTYTHYDVNFNSSKKEINSKYELVMEDSADSNTSLSLDNIYGKFYISTSADFTDYTFPDLSDWTTRVKSTVDNVALVEYSGCFSSEFVYDGALVVKDPTDKHTPLELQGGLVLTYYKYPNITTDSILGVINYTNFAINPNIYEDKSIVRVNGFCYDRFGNYDNRYSFGNLRLFDPTNTATIFNSKENIVATPIGFSKWSGDNLDLAAEGGLSNVAGEDLEYGYKIFHNADFQSYPADLYNHDYERANYRYSITDLNYNKDKKLLEFTLPNVVLNSYDYVVFNMEVEYEPDILTPFNSPFGNVYVDRDLAFLWVEISFTDTNGTKWFLKDDEWVEEGTVSDGITKIWLDARSVQAYAQKANNAFFDKVGLKNTVKDRWGLGKDVKGFAIPSPRTKRGCINGELKITICRPPGSTDYYKTASTTITNPTIKVYSSGTSFRDEQDITYSYKSTINAESLEIETALSGYTGTSCNKNTIFNLDIDETLNTFVKNVDLLHNLTTGDVMKPEELLIAGYRRQYTTQTLMLNTSIHSDEVSMITSVTYHRFPGKKFIVDGLSIDYGYDKKTVTLVEKK